MTIARHLRIHGRVQGVFYRAWTVETARGLALAGWVRNRRDGTVEAMVQGEAEAVAELIRRAHDGPANARVSRVEVGETELDPGLHGFNQASTA